MKPYYTRYYNTDTDNTKDIKNNKDTDNNKRIDNTIELITRSIHEYFAINIGYTTELHARGENITSMYNRLYIRVWRLAPRINKPNESIKISTSNTQDHTTTNSPVQTPAMRI
jgi:hypothetical protein